MGLHASVFIAVGRKFDLTGNVDVTDGMTNSAECIVQKIDYRVPNSTRPSIIWVTFSDRNIGHNHCKKYSHLYTADIKQSWVPILEITRQFKVTKRGQINVLRRQYPLRPAAAKAIHHCQGATLNGAVIDFPASTMEHMHYVALSRVQSISTLYILNLSEKKIKVSQKVKDEMFRLRTEALLKPSIPFLYNMHMSDPTCLKILFHNVRSLHLHIDDVVRDDNIEAAHVNIFVETALCFHDDSQQYQLVNFNLYRNDFHTEPNARPVYGTAVYIRNHLNVALTPFRCNYNDVEITVTVINHHAFHNLHIVGVYISKSKVKLVRLHDAMHYVQRTVIKSNPSIILGDFNVDLLSSSSEKAALLTQMIDVMGYTQLLGPQYTTDYRSQLDHIYTNVPLSVQTSGVLESYYSDHKPVFLCL